MGWIPLPKYLTIMRSDVHGLGLFAAEDIPAGLVMGVTHRPHSRAPHGYLRTSLGSWYNHSEDPNCDKVEGDEGQLFLRSMREIKTGEEILALYTVYEMEDYDPNTVDEVGGGELDMLATEFEKEFEKVVEKYKSREREKEDE